jgi:hypothetical protein
VNGLGVALMVVVFAQTEGAAEDGGAAGGTAIVGQRILEAVFGDEAALRLVRDASRELFRRIETQLWAPERQRYLDILEANVVQSGSAERLLVLSREVDDAHWLGGHR